MLNLTSFGIKFQVFQQSSANHYFNVIWSTFCLLVVFKVVSTFVRLLRKRWRAEKDLAAFPSPRRHWLLGQVRTGFTEEAFQLYETELNAPYSPARVTWVGPFDSNVMLFHPSVVQPWLASTEVKDEVYYGFLRPWLGDGLLLSRGKKWFRNRRLLTPGFHFDILKPYVTVFDECATKLVSKWKELCRSSSSGSVKLEMFEHISLMTLDSLLKCIFSQNSHCQTKKKHPYIQAVYDLASLVIQRARFPPYYNDVIYYISPGGYTWRRALEQVHGYAWKVIRERKAALAQEGSNSSTQTRKHVDFLDILLKAKDEDGNGLTDQEIKDEVDTFMFEGHDTTASGISWCLYNLANNPQHQQKCRQEVNDLLQRKGSENFEWDDLSKLSHLTLCIKESLRMTPPVPFISRRLTSQLALPDGRTIPAGYRVAINIASLHRNQLIWEEPDVFKPERFTVENSKDRSPYAYIPFSAGPRNCIGQNFAMNEMKITIARILHNFELNVVKNSKPKRLMGLVLRSVNGIQLNVTPCTK
ncbi:cytochrome P450 4F1-like [Glandiceps talaboti]